MEHEINVHTIYFFSHFVSVVFSHEMPISTRSRDLFFKSGTIYFRLENKVPNNFFYNAFFYKTNPAHVFPLNSSDIYVTGLHFP